MLYEEKLKEYKELEKRKNEASEFLEIASINYDMHNLASDLYEKLGLKTYKGKVPSYQTLKELVEKFKKENKK